MSSDFIRLKWLQLKDRHLIPKKHKLETTRRVFYSLKIIPEKADNEIYSLIIPVCYINRLQ